MRVVSLGSGSSGNAVVVQSGESAVLVDAGFSARTLTSRLRQVGVAPSSIRAICVTHEHSDHACGALTFARQHGIPLVSDPRTLKALLSQPSRGAEPDAPPPERVELRVGTSSTIAGLDIRSFAISHDAVAPCGYLISSAAWRVCVVTDTGLVHEPILEALRAAHLIVLESNHDLDRLRTGPYPWHLKQRILSPTGHLSNAQTSAALELSLDDGPRWVWLAHLSRTNNTPDIARAHVREHLRSLGLRHIQPQPLPPGVGPVWDSATLWGPDVQAVPSTTTATAPSTATVRSRT